MLEYILLNILMQLIYFVGIVFLFGYIISLVNRGFYSLVSHSRAVCYATGIIGTPIHEISHAVMCIIFGHRINEMRLFQIDRESGTLGYVQHSYKKGNVYQIVGNFFIGTAPIVVGTLIIFLLIKFMLPVAFTDINEHIHAFANQQAYGFNVELVSTGFNSIFGIVGSIFSGIDTGFLWWVFMILALCIALHMNLSSLDIKGSLKALPILILVVVAVNFFLGYVFKDAYLHFVDFMSTAGSYLSSALLLSLVLSLFCLAIAGAVKLVLWLPKRLTR